MNIKEFCEKYSSIATENLKEKYLKDNLHIKTYVPFLVKVTLADKLTKVTMLDKDSNIDVKSDINYLLFCRTIVEQYTGLQSGTEGFYEEYDLLNESGLLDKIMQMIPEKEIAEFKMICDFKRDDLLFNQSTPKAFVSQQIERITTIASVTLKPVLEKISGQIKNIDEKDFDKITKALERGLKRIK